MRDRLKSALPNPHHPIHLMLEMGTRSTLLLSLGRGGPARRAGAERGDAFPGKDNISTLIRPPGTFSRTGEGGIYPHPFPRIYSGARWRQTRR